MSLPLKKSDSVFIGGEWVKPRGEPEAVVNPATEAVIGLAPVGGRQEVSDAIAAARDAFDKGPWPRMAPAERAAKLRELFDALMARKADIVRLIVEEAGSPRGFGEMVHFGVSMEHARYFIESGARNRDLPATLTSAQTPAGPTLMGNVVRREPVGVVAAITPYNFPYYLNVMKIFPALVTGNTVVLKPSPFTPFAALIIGEVAEQVGLPRGVLSILTGGKEVGEMMTTDPRVDLITFTGSDAVGAAIMSQGAATLKRLHFELGGKSANIVRADADIPTAIAAGMQFVFHCGQGCALATRHLVHNSIRAKYVEALQAAVGQLKVGDPEDPSVTLGPLIREAQRARVERFVDEGRSAGAKLVLGGKRPAGLKKGYFYEPTIFDNVDNKSSIAQEEIFGPVASIIGFDTDEEAIDLANDSKYGLSGGVYSKDLGAAFAIATALRTGGVYINGGGATGAPPAPFGGYKRSGFGRENGEEGLNAYTELKTVSFRS